MSNPAWNEDKSAGIEAIDDGHEEILSIISRIIESIDNKHTKSTIEEHFDDLERFISSHIKREEALMRSTNHTGFEQRKKDHQDFLVQLSDFKEELFNNNSDEAPEEAGQRLYDWAINHVNTSDMGYAQIYASHQSQAKKKASHSLVIRISNWLSHHIRLSMRVFFIAILPIAGMLILSFIILKDNYLQYKNMQLLSASIHTASQVNALTHSLQVERGLSLGFVSSNYQQFAQELAERRKITDTEIEAFLAQLNSQVTEPSRQTRWLSYIQKTKTDVARLKEYRSKIEYQSVYDLDQMFSNYTLQISKLLSGTNDLVHLDMDSQYANDITTIDTILNFKEMMGQERALGTLLLGQAIHSRAETQEMNILLGRQLDALRTFNYSSTDQQKKICADLCNEVLHKSKTSQLFPKLMALHNSAQARQKWFMSMTAKMDSVKLIADNIIHELKIKTDQKLAEIHLRYHTVLTILSSIILLNLLLFAFLNHSIIAPIRFITHALTQIALGHKTLQVYSYFARDEIGSMYKAYEMLRRKLVQADLSKNVINFQRKSLRHRKKESDRYKELASRDALTGALNRREFNKIINQEIQHSQQENYALSIMSLDIDHFKSINDTYGHGTGDLALINFYTTCCENVRASDVVARIGGEEFVILMPGMSVQQAATSAERIRKSVEELRVVTGDQAISFTVSIGVTQWNASQFSGADEFLAFADTALYEAKNRGRNCIVVKPE